MAVEYEELKITVSLDDNASGPINVLRTNLQQLADVPQRIPRGENLDPAIAKTAEYVKSLLALGRGFEALKGLVSPVTLGLAVVGYEFYRGIRAIRDYTEQVANMTVVAKQAGISFAELRNVTSQLEASGVAIDKVTASVQGLNNTIAQLVRPWSELRTQLMENAGPAGAEQMEEWIDKLTAAKTETERLNVAMEGARQVYKNALAESGNEIEARNRELRFMRDIGLDPAMIRREQDLAKMTEAQTKRWEQLSKYSTDFHERWGEIHRLLSLVDDIFLSYAMSPNGPFMSLTEGVLNVSEKLLQTWEDIDERFQRLHLPPAIERLLTWAAGRPRAEGESTEHLLTGGKNPFAAGIQLGTGGGPNPFGASVDFMRRLGIPGFAEGGVVNQPTLAMIGEGGPEAVLPLAGLNANAKDQTDATDQNTATINELTALLQQWNEAMGFTGGGGTSGGAGATGSWGGGGTTGTTGGGRDSAAGVGGTGTGKGETKGILGGPETRGQFRPYVGPVPGGLAAEVANRYSAAGTPVDTRGASQVALSNGVKFMTNSANAPQVQGFLNELIAMGAPITQAASYGSRPKNASAHPHGLATDVNQSGRGVLNNPAFGKWIQQHQQQINEAEIRWNQVGGEHWKSPDTGHWTMGRQMSADELAAAQKASQAAIDKAKSTQTAMAEGGIVTSPTNAVLGERGPEAVVPMRRGGRPLVYHTPEQVRAQQAYYTSPVTDIANEMGEARSKFRHDWEGVGKQGSIGAEIGHGIGTALDTISYAISPATATAHTTLGRALGGVFGGRARADIATDIGAAFTSIPLLGGGLAVTGAKAGAEFLGLGEGAVAATELLAQGGTAIGKAERAGVLPPLIGSAGATPMEPFGGEMAMNRSTVDSAASRRAGGGGTTNIKISHGIPEGPGAPKIPVFDGHDMETQTQMADAHQGPASDRQLSPIEVRGVGHLAH